MKTKKFKIDSVSAGYDRKLVFDTVECGLFEIHGVGKESLRKYSDKKNQIVIHKLTPRYLFLWTGQTGPRKLMMCFKMDMVENKVYRGGPNTPDERTMLITNKFEIKRMKTEALAYFKSQNNISDEVFYDTLKKSKI
jgi:hypothetical protein